MSEDNLYAAHAPLIELVIMATCRAHRLPRDHADEFRSWANVRLLEHDQAILRKFSGRSLIRTYLTTVVERLFLDWRNHEWGKWRPSSEARRSGAVAIELERLVLRDRVPLGEAVRMTVDGGHAPDAETCYAVWARLPQRPRRQRVGEEQLFDRPAPGPVRDPVDAAALREQRARLMVILEQAVAALPAGDQAILRLRYWSGVPVSRLAVTTGEDPKQLYRRFERILRELRHRFTELGVEGELGDLFDGFDPDEGGGPESRSRVDEPQRVEPGTDFGVSGPSAVESPGGTHG